jgi:hypothetical protein
MPMTLEEYRRRFRDRPEPIPLEYASKWIALSDDCRKIVASGNDLTDVRKRAERDGYPDAILHYVMPYPCFGFGPRR